MEIFTSHIFHRKCVQREFVTSEFRCGEILDLALQVRKAYLVGIAFDFRSDAHVVELVQGNQINLVFPLAIPPVAHRGVLASLHHQSLEILLQCSTRELLVSAQHILLQERKLSAFHQRLIWPHKAEPESQELVRNFVCTGLAGRLGK